jgi:hypothetical protein
MEKQQYVELEEDLDWSVNDDVYDHLSRPGQAKSELKVTADPTYNRIGEDNSVYNLTTTSIPTNKVTTDDVYSHIKDTGTPEQGMYDTLQNKRMRFSDDTNKLTDTYSTLS